MASLSARFALLLPLGIALIAAAADQKDEKRPTSLVEGPLEISFKNGQKKTKFGPSEAKLVLASRYNRERVPSEGPNQWLIRKYGEKGHDRLELKVDGARYSLLVIDGAVQPLLLHENQEELWMIDGLQDYCKSASIIEPAFKKVTIAHRLGDAQSRLTLDFNKGCKVSYHESFQGP